MEMIKAAPISLPAHAGMLKQLFPQGVVVSLHPELEWVCSLQPTPLSIRYQIKLLYRLGGQPQVYVVKPQLQPDQSQKLPHVYSVEQQKLCLHYPPEKKWHARQPLARTIVPWAAEWLFHYEIWQVTGMWNGGGIEHNIVVKNAA